MAGIHKFLGTVEVPKAKTNSEAVNLGQVKDLVNRYNKEPVKVATTGELGGTVIDGVMTLTTDLNTIDGITMELGDSVLVKDEINKKNNAIYTITKLGSSGTPSSATASTTSSTITNVTVNKTTFETKISTSTDKTYTFTYSATDTSWKDESLVAVTLSDYGISIEGTETDNDTISIVYKSMVSGVGGELTLRNDWSEGTIILNNTFVNVMMGTDNQDTRWTVVSDGVLTVGTSDFTFIKDIDVAQSTLKIVKANLAPDGVEKVFNIAHNLNLSDEYGYILKVLDKEHNEVFVDNVPKIGDEKNAITLRFDETPEVTESFAIYILGLE